MSMRYAWSFDNSIARCQNHAVVYCKLTMFTTNVIIFYCTSLFSNTFFGVPLRYRRHQWVIVRERNGVIDPFYFLMTREFLFFFSSFLRAKGRWKWKFGQCLRRSLWFTNCSKRQTCVVFVRSIQTFLFEYPIYRYKKRVRTKERKKEGKKCNFYVGT